jgi:hypothetical protein
VCRTAARRAIAENDQSLSGGLRWISWFSPWKRPKNTLVPDFYSRKKNPYKSTLFHVVGSLANNLIHIKCAEVKGVVWLLIHRCTPACFLRILKIPFEINEIGLDQHVAHNVVHRIWA